MNRFTVSFLRRLAVVALLCFFQQQHLSAQNLIVNGSFENVSNSFVADGNGAMSLPVGSTNIPGWTTTNGELLWLHNGDVFGPVASDGTLFLDFTGYHDSAPYGGVTQILPTTPGQIYTASFNVGQFQERNIYAGPVSIMATTGAEADNIFTFSPTNGGANQWTNFQTSFIAQSDSTIITLSGKTSAGGQYIGLDNASLLPIGGGPDLLVNGNFENGAFVNQTQGAMSLPVGAATITGWTVANAEVAWITNSTPLGIATPYGSLFLDLTGFHDSLPYGGVSQTVTTIPGQTYVLSFAVGVDQANGSYAGPASVRATVVAGMQFQTSITRSDWQPFTFSFIANSTNTPLTFIGASTKGGQYIGLDNVSVIAGPPPFIITRVTPNHSTNLIIDFNSEAGHSYALQSSPDLAANSWTTLAGTTNNGTGGIISTTLTNAINGVQQFYRVEKLQ